MIRSAACTIRLNAASLLIAALIAGHCAFLCGGIEQAHAAKLDAPVSGTVREPVLAGTWYPASEDALRGTVQDYLSRVPHQELQGRLFALISPHAGYPYSGQIAAYAYKLLEKQRFDTVVIVAPSHRVRFDGVSIYDQGGYKTPLGVVPIDHELTAALKKRDSRIRYVPEADGQEHAVEIQLPFLQTAMPGFKLVSLIMGDQGLAACEQLASALSDCIQGKSVLIVASSDLSHFHPYEEANSLDQVLREKVSALDPRGLSDMLASGRCEACGGGPIITAMLFAQRMGANRSTVLRCANSGDVTGEKNRVVGYLAAALWSDGKSEGAHKEPPAPSGSAGLETGLTSEDKAALLQIARKSIEAKLRGDKLQQTGQLSPTLKKSYGAFVTLNKQGELRGCIGHIVADRPLAEIVAEMAEAAAFHDPRFPPVRADELNALSIEISVLSPLRRIASTEEIQVGTHGIIMKRGLRSGLLLPQVATEYGWDRNTFLEHTCLKAGLPPDAWKDSSTEIYIFSADIFPQ